MSIHPFLKSLTSTRTRRRPVRRRTLKGCGYRPQFEALEDRLVPANNPALIVPAFNSLPGAAASLYLDFNGHFEPHWGSRSIDTPAYDIDGDENSFNAQELADIETFWRYVAEDFAPFKLNVTTVEPPSFANGVALRAAIGGAGTEICGSACQALWIRDNFTSSAPNVNYIFPKSFDPGTSVSYMATKVSMVSGGGFGLDGFNTARLGDGTGAIMGAHVSSDRTLWWYGTNAYGNPQHDMDVIARTTNVFGYRIDDHGDNATTATPLAVTDTGAVSGEGIIAKMTDLDYFSFRTGAGPITLTANVEEPYNNLDLRLELYDAAGTKVAEADPPSPLGSNYDATITFVAPAAGSYRLVVASHGVSDNATPTNYGFNVGQYTISGNVVPLAPQSLFTVSPTSGLVTTEAGGTDQFSVVLNTQPLADVTIPLSSNDSSEGSVSPTSLTFTPENWNQAQTVTVTGVDDAIIDGDVGYSIITGPASSSDPLYNGMDPDDVSVTNQDNEPPPAISISDVRMKEGDSGTTAFIFTVRLSAASAGTVTVNYATADGTAQAGSDYQATSGTLTFAPGETSKSITVLVNGDTVKEFNEAFYVDLSGASNATIADGHAVATVLNDDRK